MVVYENIFLLKFSQNFMSKKRLKKILIDNYYKTIFENSQNGVLFVHHVW